MRKALLITVIVIIISILPIFTKYAIGQPPVPDTQPIPIDGGLFLLIIAGASYGARKLYKQQNED
ncbi:MAG: hypothetical protein GXO49_05625 [Chlorobi bacterium]|nr:hypothetical protein [Chlorobiota bacterium]